MLSVSQPAAWLVFAGIALRSGWEWKVNERTLDGWELLQLPNSRSRSTAPAPPMRLRWLRTEYVTIRRCEPEHEWFPSIFPLIWVNLGPQPGCGFDVGLSLYCGKWFLERLLDLEIVSDEQLSLRFCECFDTLKLAFTLFRSHQLPSVR